MFHNQVNDDPNGGHWAASRSGDEQCVLVQIGEVDETRQTRLKLSPPSALHLAADLLNGAKEAAYPGSLQIGGEDMPWEIRRTLGITTLTLRDPIGIADPESTLPMSAEAMHAMGLGVLRVATDVLMQPAGTNDLQGLVAAAIHLHDEERDLHQWEYDLDFVGACLARLDPSKAGGLCRRLASVQSASDIAFQGCCAAHAQIRDRAARPIPVEGGNAMAREHAAEAARLGDRHLSVRTRMRKLDSAIGDAIAALRDQDIDERLIRLAAGRGERLSIDELVEMVRADHRAISDTLGDWRLMHSPAVLQIAGSNTRQEVIDALHRLARTGQATLHHSLTMRPRWTLNHGVAKAA